MTTYQLVALPWQLNRTPEWFNVKDYGAVGDGTTDDTAAIQSALDACPPYGTVYFPCPVWRYRITEALSRADTPIHLLGDGRGPGVGVANVGAAIFGEFSGPLVDFGSVEFAIGSSIQRLGFYNTAGDGLRITGHTLPIIRDCDFTCGGVGLNLPDPTSALVESCGFTGDSQTGTGLFTASHTNILSCDIRGLDRGIQVCGYGVNIMGCRTEECNIGFLLGADATDTNSAWSGMCLGNTFESNYTTGIEVRSAVAALISGCVINDGGHPTSSSLQITALAQHTTLSHLLMAKECSITGVTVGSAFRHCSADSWVIPADQRGLTFEHCNNPGGGQMVLYRTAAPTGGTWALGDIVYNAAPAAGGTIGWVCTTAGTPGTWKTFGAIEA